VPPYYKFGRDRFSRGIAPFKPLFENVFHARDVPNIAQQNINLHDGIEGPVRFG
jgi:hypothetical protein